MKIINHVPPRAFRTGRGAPIELLDCARIDLEPDELVTFVTPSGAQYDVARKAWGFYATPSLNGRLKQFGLRAALVKNFVGKFYILLVEADREADFRAYLEAEDNVLIRWMDQDDQLNAIPADENAVHRQAPDIHCMCGADRLFSVHMYFERPATEVVIPAGDRPYRRELFQCGVCRHFVSMHDMELGAFYGGGYVDATYGGFDGITRQFQRIIALPPAQSDNAGRVARVTEFGRGHFGPDASPTILDVGSGLGVFVAAMKRAGWQPTALDPDERAVRHARETIGVAAIEADFMTGTAFGQYDSVSFNKVLEHVKDPVTMLSRAGQFLRHGGFVYVEVPDGECAAADTEGFGREEFFIEHHHVFSAASAALLISRAGFTLISIERLREPSGKYTLRLFAEQRQAPSGSRDAG